MADGWEHMRRGDLRDRWQKIGKRSLVLGRAGKARRLRRWRGESSDPVGHMLDGLAERNEDREERRGDA